MIIPFANIFQPLINVFESILVWIHDNIVGGSWGFAIIGLTIVVRAAILPLTLKQFRSMQALQRLAPEIKALQARHKEDKQRLNEEMMKFYRENKVNPLGSCLPLALQMPVFLALFYMLRRDLKLDICGPTARILEHGHSIATTACDKVEPGSAKFLFIPDLTDKATGTVLIALIVLYVGTQLASSMLMSVSADPTQRRLMMVLPLVFVAFIINFPSGLIVYWITTNTWTIAQQYVIRRTVGPIRPPGMAPATGGGLAGLLGGGRGGGSSGAAAAKPPSGGGSGAKAKAKAAGGAGATAKAPPPSARKKKKRSGRRR